MSKIKSFYHDEIEAAEHQKPDHREPDTGEPDLSGAECCDESWWQQQDEQFKDTENPAF